CVPQAFSIPLSQVIANDRAHRQRQDAYRLDPPQREEHKDSSDLVSSILQFATKRPSNKELSSSNSSLSSTSETANESTSPNTPESAPRTVGIFRVGSSKKRVRQLREEFDRGIDVQLDEEHSVHDVAALLKEFLRDMPDPLLTRELYTAFINTT
ncbi:hypothetical protein XENOCAPTIV_018833, partial [Xenoophorus captivus]